MPYWQVRTMVDKAIEDALRQSNGIDELIEELHNRIVRFRYRKTDGSIRDAIGPLKENLLTEITANRKSSQARHNECVVYFDLERNAWRCFCPENFIAIE